MPIRLSDLKKDQRTCTVEFGEESAEVVYRPSAYTAELETGIQEATERNMPGKLLATILEAMISHWAVIGEDGQELAPTAENLSKLPIEFLAEVVRVITEDIGAGLETRKNSAAGSPQRAR